MAVSQSKMLGHYIRGPCSYKCPHCSEPGTRSWRQRIERREVANLIAEETGPDRREWLASIGYLSADDLLDCRHGCPGGRSCSDQCNFTCHEEPSPSLAYGARFECG